MVTFYNNPIVGTESGVVSYDKSTAVSCECDPHGDGASRRQCIIDERFLHNIDQCAMR